MACDSVFVEVQGLHGGAGMSRGPQDKGCSMPTSHWLRDLTSPWRLSQKPGQERRKARGEGSILAHRQPSQWPSSEGSSGPGFWTSPCQWIQFQVWGASHFQRLLYIYTILFFFKLIPQTLVKLWFIRNCSSRCPHPVPINESYQEEMRSFS